MSISPLELVWNRNDRFALGLKKGPKELTDSFQGFEKVEKTFWFCDIFIF